MSLSIRSWAAASAHCSRRARCPKNINGAVRYLSNTSPEQVPLQTEEDWSQFQVKRAEYKSLVDHFSQYGSTQTRDSTFQPHHELNRPKAPSELALSSLMAAGAHMGHSQTLMNPNFMPYAYGVRSGITIIDLDHTLPLLRRAAKVVRATAAKGGSIVFIGTRPDLRPTVRKAAERLGSQGFHVGERWMPGTLTNKLALFGGDIVAKERIVPDLVILLNPIPNMHAIRECAYDHIPTIGIVDSNVDPRIVMYPIPANDESTRTAELVAGVLSIAGREGVMLYQEEHLQAGNDGQRQRVRQTFSS
ncbi:ribosomal protein S2 [Obba rivulosa]|uniref:Ribosomal protein S2 n=1 Tax=Obba rivulosa TaxID=1052685 RepID=A0A8E2DTP6_9APHY|nr:ribosomal protein S2 [Obba rivulosa]